MSKQKKIDASVLIEVYVQAYETLRHYSGLIINVRTVTIAQGFAILAAAGVLITEQELYFATFVVIFGILFSIVLFGLHKNYLDYFMDTQQYIIDLEKKHSELFLDFCTTVEVSRNKRVNKNFNSMWIVNGAHILILSALITMAFFITYSLIRNST